jgi:hypothetical protein
MKPLLAVVVIAIVLGGVAWLFFPRRSNASEGGFLDFVRHPEKAGYNSEYSTFEERDQIVAELAKRPPEELVAMLRDDADSFGLPARAIEAAWPKPLPALIEALSDPAFRGGNQRRFDMPMEPVEGVLSCLAEFGAPEAIGAAQKLAGDDKESVRKGVALFLGSTGANAAAEPMVQLLSDEEPYVRSYCFLGIERAARGKRLSPGFCSVVFDALQPLSLLDDYHVRDAPKCLLLLDRERAIVWLTAKEHLAPDQANLDVLLESLFEADVQVDEELLLAVADSKLSAELKYSGEKALSFALKLLARKDSTAARERIAKGHSHASARVREATAEAEAILVGLKDPLDFAWRRQDEVGWDNLTASQQHVIAVRSWIDEVNNGGMLQYFVNSSGDHWEVALAGLRAIGGDGDAAVFEKALARFPNSRPSSVRSERHAQTAAIARHSDDPFAKEEKAFYEDSQDREVLLQRYILKCAADFR